MFKSFKRIHLLIVVLLIAIIGLVFSVKNKPLQETPEFIVPDSIDKVPAPQDYGLWNASATQPLPTLVMLHGRGSSAIAMSRTEKIRDLAKQGEFTLVLSDGNEKMGIRIDSEPAYDWNASKTEVLIKRLEVLFESSHVSPQIDRDRVYLVGLSAGAAMAYQTAVAKPGMFAGVIGFSGYLNQNELNLLKNKPLEKAAEEIPIVAHHGNSDENIQMELGKQALDFFNEKGFKTRWEIFEGGHSLPASLTEIIQRDCEWIDAQQK
ncbi:MAG: alpha/beta hydrolase [Candidatus Rifleibacteriota bacterium]